MLRALIFAVMRLYIIAILILLPSLLSAQTKSTSEIHDKYDDAFTMFFYQSTLKMVAGDDEELMEAIKGIEKAKLLRIRKDSQYEASDLTDYIAGIQDEDFEEVMSIKQGEGNIVVYLKGDDEPEGVVLLIEEERSLSILDVVGFLRLDKISVLTKQIEFTEGLKLPKID